MVGHVYFFHDWSCYISLEPQDVLGLSQYRCIRWIVSRALVWFLPPATPAMKPIANDDTIESRRIAPFTAFERDLDVFGRRSWISSPDNRASLDSDESFVAVSLRGSSSYLVAIACEEMNAWQQPREGRKRYVKRRRRMKVTKKYEQATRAEADGRPRRDARLPEISPPQSAPYRS